MTTNGAKLCTEPRTIVMSPHPSIRKAILRGMVPSGLNYKANWAYQDLPSTRTEFLEHVIGWRLEYCVGDDEDHKCDKILLV